MRFIRLARLEPSEYLIGREVHDLKVAAVEPGGVSANERRFELVPRFD